MGFKDFHLKFKVFNLRRFLTGGDSEERKRETENGKRPSWMVPISHGFHVVDDDGSFRDGSDESDVYGSDSVVVQREQIEETELWFFGVSDARVGDGVTKYMQSHLFAKNTKESQLRRKSKETLWRAYVSARAKVREGEKQEERRKVGSASAIIINGDKLVLANMGDYKAIVCRDGEAYQVSQRKHNLGPQRHWSRKFIPGVISMPRVRILACNSRNAAGTKSSKSTEVAVSSEKVDSDTEFIILASTGIWEVMKHQEAVNLIRHIEDPEEAAECLTKEALTRMSRSSISCLVIRFD